jgi:hypothetical protein
MKSVRSALEVALGLKFEGDKGEHFFRSTLVQTIFYGIFSAWVLWSKKRSYTAPDIFSWHDALWELKVPVMQALFGQIVTPAHMGPLELEDTLDWASSTLNRVDRASFFSAFEEGKAVQYFYEPFLEAFDRELRKQLGVWYTPPEIVQYMVSRVDTILREELNIADGLADQNVFVLDPCCGTGSYLVEVLKHIHQTLKTKGADALLASDLKQAALQRVFGFEILPAPFVISHMQLGLLLQNLGAPLSETPYERAGVYLTNALTGWEPLDAEKEKAFQAMFPELREEQTEARKVKQKVPILVILGNPPYNAFAGTATTKEERDSVAPYKEGLIKKWGIKKFNLDDLYVRFFRMAERRIAEQTGRGVVSFISNHSWIEEPSFAVLRQHLLQSFDVFWIENLHGNRKISEYTPDGRTSETIFAIPGFSVGIRQGVATSLWVKKTEKTAEPKIRFRDDLNAARAVERRKQLLDSLGTKDFNSHYQFASPSESNRYSFRPSKVSAEYLAWPSLENLTDFKPTLGILENRKEALIDIDKPIIENRMKLYYDPNTSWESLVALNTGLTQDAARYDARKTREIVLSAETYNAESIRKTLTRPMDYKWCYYSSIRPLWNEPRPNYISQCWNGNAFIVTRRKGAADPEGIPFFYTVNIGVQHSMQTDAYYIPIRLRTVTTNQNKKPKEQTHLIQPEEDNKAIANLSTFARNYLISLGIDNLDMDGPTAGLVWMHALAIGYSPTYLDENADGIRKDWPRIPLPGTKSRLEASAELGEKVAALLDTEKPVAGVTASPIRPEIQTIAAIKREDGGQLQPKELAVTVGWGHAGQNGVVMPGKGKAIERDYTVEEKQAIVNGAGQLGISPEQALELLGQRTFDIYLNDVACWKNMPEKVWDYTIGGYQVIKKWLSYREADLLKRPLTRDEAREVMNMARRIAAVVLLHPTLDENYYQCKANTYK